MGAFKLKMDRGVALFVLVVEADALFNHWDDFSQSGGFGFGPDCLRNIIGIISLLTL